MNNDKPARLAHRGHDGLKIQRTEAARVYNLNRDAFSGQLFSGLQGDAYHFLKCQNGHVSAAPTERGLANRHDVVPFGDLSARPVEPAVFYKEDRIIVANSRF